MKEILFRGIAQCDHKWKYGYYCKMTFELLVEMGIISKELEPYCNRQRTFDTITMNGTIYPLLHNTVCSYTGATDKYGSLIFEGDVVHVINTAHSIDCKFTVIWDEHYLKFSFKDKDGDMHGFSADMLKNDGDVVGNIYKRMLGI